MEQAASPGRVFVVSAPSGAGKHTVLKRVLSGDARLGYSISATTRPPRAGELNGRDYHFLDRETFEKRVSTGGFAEWAEVHGNLYGTLRSELDRAIESGKDVLLELDVQGMRNMRRLGLDMVSVFIMAPSLEELEQRLRSRGTDSDDVIALRLKNARDEIAAKDEYDHVIVNVDIREAVEELKGIIRAARERADHGGTKETST
ncbi:MAG: guanylate kinase [Candidatus Hydrogenedentes bacterium]|nr:guanylate kinase [Candidatus Hydrogenedentota bacterium]